MANAAGNYKTAENYAQERASQHATRNKNNAAKRAEKRNTMLGSGKIVKYNRNGASCIFTPLSSFSDESATYNNIMDYGPAIRVGNADVDNAIDKDYGMATVKGRDIIGFVLNDIFYS